MLERILKHCVQELLQRDIDTMQSQSMEDAKSAWGESSNEEGIITLYKTIESLWCQNAVDLERLEDALLKSKCKIQEKEDTFLEHLEDYVKKEELWIRKKKEHEDFEAKEKK